MVVVEALLEQGTLKYPGRGRPKRVVADKGSSSSKIRWSLCRRGIRMTIPRKQHERRTGPFDREQYRERNRVERLINRLNQFRRIPTRYEKRTVNYKAMLTLAATLLWLKFESRP